MVLVELREHLRTYETFTVDQILRDILRNYHYAPVICIHGPLGTGDIGDIAGLKCRNLTSDVSRQCRGCAGALISR